MDSATARTRRRWVAGAAAGLLAVAIAAGALGWRWRAVASDLARERDRHATAYTGSSACSPCHAEHAASWHRTFHRTMTEDVGVGGGSRGPADPVAGDFSGATYRYQGTTARMHRDQAGRYVMTFEGGPGQKPVDAVVVRSVGSRRYQQYLAEANGALWRLPMAYHVEERRWFHMNGAFLTPDPEVGEGAHDGDRARAGDRPRFGGEAFDRHVTRWNDNCVFCHNVAPNPGLERVTGRLRTQVAELGVACEACHGPGGEHVSANRDPVRRYVLHVSGAADPTIVNPSRLSAARAADLCGRCHGQRMADDVEPFLAHGDPFVPGDALGLYSAPLWRDTPLAGDPEAFAARFWDDGTPRLTAYEYQGLLQSACNQRGALTCTSCHGMHDGDPRGQLRPEARGDRACTGCHAGLRDQAALAAHARHDPAGPGARCVACHMPRIVYGVLDVHVSHRIEVPDPARAVAFGRPDACTSCHVDRDRVWAVEARRRLWPTPGAASASRDDPPRAKSEADHLAPADALFAGDPIARTVAAYALGTAPLGAGAGCLTRAHMLLAAIEGDRYPAVRHLAARALGQLLAAAPPAGASLAPTALAIDATGDQAARARAVAAIRAALAASGCAAGRGPSVGPVAAGGALDPARLARLRAEARRADIDIGE